MFPKGQEPLATLQLREALFISVVKHPHDTAHLLYSNAFC